MEFLRKYKNTILRYSFLLFLMIFTASIVLKNLDLNKLSDLKNIIDGKYIVIGVGSVFLYIFLEGVILKLILDAQCKVKGKFMGLKLATMGFYYNLVTPFASGSQPMLIYVLNKHDVSLSEATGIITNKTILYQATVTIYCTIFFFLNIGILQNEIPKMMPLVILGICINAFTIIAGLLAILNPQKIKVISRFLIGHLSKIKFLKFLEAKSGKIDNFIEEYSQSVKFFMTNKKLLLKTIVLTVLQLTAYFSVSFWIYKSFNLDTYSFAYMIALQTFLYMAVSPMPTPGNIGANEFAFFSIFTIVFPKSMLGYAVLLYGGLVYYLILVGSGIITLLTHIQIKEKVDTVNNQGILKKDMVPNKIGKMQSL